MTIPEPYRQFIEGAQQFQAEATEILARAEAKKAKEPSLDTRPLLIGLGGKLASGKDTLADFLVSEYGFEKLGMSDPLAHALYTLNPLVSLEFENNRAWAEDSGIDLDPSSPGAPVIERYRDIYDIVGYVQAKRIPEVRRLLQVLGTEVGRQQLGDDTWTKVAARNIEELRSQGIPVALTGIRYGNERALIEELGGILVWLERPEPNMLAFGIEGMPPAENVGQAVIKAIDNALDPSLAQFHSSEVSLTKDDFHVVVQNDGSLDTLKQRTIGLIETLRLMQGEQPSVEG